MSFGYFMYSHSLVLVIDLWISGRDKVGLRALMIIADLSSYCFVFSLHYCGIRMICQFCHHCFLKFALCLVLVVFCFVWFVFSE